MPSKKPSLEIFPIGSTKMLQGIDVVCYFINQSLSLCFWEGRLRHEFEAVNPQAIGGLRATILTATMTSIRAFEEFCGEGKYPDDMVAACFPGLNLAPFLGEPERVEINKRVPHITLLALEEFNGFNYKKHLASFLPVAIEFLKYASLQVGGDPERAKRVGDTMSACEEAQTVKFHSV